MRNFLVGCLTTLRLAPQFAIKDNAKKITLSPMADKLAYVGKSLAHPGRYTQNHLAAKPDEDINANNSFDRFCAAQPQSKLARSYRFISKLRLPIVSQNKKYCFQNQNDRHQGVDSPALAIRYAALEKSQPATIDEKNLIDVAVKSIAKKLSTPILTDKALQIDKEWRAQERMVFLPARINALIDKKYMQGVKENTNADRKDPQKNIFNGPERKEIIEKTLQGMGLSAAYANVKNIETAAQTSIQHTVRLYLHNAAINNPDIINVISDRVYETIFAEPGQVARVLRSAEKLIDREGFR